MTGGWVARLPVLLLGLLGVSHVALVALHDLSPWLGGGFGMFSTTDRRHLVAVVVDGAAPDRQLTLPGRFDDEIERARALPTPGRLEALARAASNLDGGCPRVRVEVWLSVFIGRDEAPAGRRIAVAEATCRPT